MPIPDDYLAFLKLTPQEVQSLTDELVRRPLSAQTVEAWLRDWVDIEVLFQESLARRDIACGVNGADVEAAELRKVYRQTIWPIGERFSAAMDARLPEHETILPQNVLPYIIRMKRQLNQSDELVALLNQEAELTSQYGALLGAEKTITWQGQMLNEHQAEERLASADAQTREGIQQALAALHQQESDGIVEIWRNLLDVRQSLAEKNGFADYLAYRWYEMGRDDYSIDDSHALHRAFQDYWSPLYGRIKAREQACSDQGTPAYPELPKPFKGAADLVAKVRRVFHRFDPEFEAEYERLIQVGLLNVVDSQRGWGFARVVGRAGVFVLVNITPESDDIAGLIHEMGHVFAAVASSRQPYHFFWGCPFDFGETPSSVMEMLTMPYWSEFYEDTHLPQVKRLYFGGMVIGNLEMVIQEAFQLWAYSHLDAARDAAQCSAKWLELHQTYMPGTDWLAQRDEVAARWQYMHFLFHAPLFGMEYVYGRLAGLNLLDVPDAVARYKKAIALGNITGAKDAFMALGTHFPFTREAVANAAKQVEVFLF